MYSNNLYKLYQQLTMMAILRIEIQLIKSSNLDSEDFALINYSWLSLCLTHEHGENSI